MLHRRTPPAWRPSGALANPTARSVAEWNPCDNRRRPCADWRCAYAIPNEVDSDESYARHHGLDLKGLSPDELVLEEHVARAALGHLALTQRRDLTTRAWWLSRLRRILERRRCIVTELRRVVGGRDAWRA